jgi:UDP-glucose 4-epimerase
MRVAVTGAAGFIGSTLVDRLLADGHTVCGIDDLSTGQLSNLDEARTAGLSSPGSFTFVRADITTADFPDVLAAQRPQVVCHLAAQPDVRHSVADPRDDALRNVVGTVTTLEGARRAGAGKVVAATSGGTIYGERGSEPVSERVALAPASPYAAGKGAVELYLAAFAAMYGLAWTALALGNVYGPRQDPGGEAGVVTQFASALLAGRPTVVYGDGSALRDYVYVDDAVDAFARALGSSGNGRRLNVGTGRPTSVTELHTLVAAATGRPDTPVFAPPRTGEIGAIVLDPTAARRALGWTPWTGLPEGIAATVGWLRAGGAGRRG